MCGFNFESKSLKANASGGEVNEAAETIASDKETSEKTVETYPSPITKFGTSSIIENTLVYDGEKIPMHPTFEDKEAAIQDLYGQAGEFLSKIEEKYGIGTLCSDNWKKYYEDVLADEPTGNLDTQNSIVSVLLVAAVSGWVFEIGERQNRCKCGECPAITLSHSSDIIFSEIDVTVTIPSP